MWFIFSLICILGWGFADLFYKKSSDENDRYSHLKIAVWVGIVMGVCSFALLLIPNIDGKTVTFDGLFSGIVKYFPASLGYIISMVIGYAGLRYLELSIVSPVQNASGALSAVTMMIFFALRGKISSIGDEFSPLELTGTGIIVVGVIALAFTQQKLSKAQSQNEDKKYKFGALALLFPILYCVFDTIGTAADGIILDEQTGLGLGEIDVLILYGLTFFAAGIVAWLFLAFKNKKIYNPFAKSESSKMIAAGCEEFGQIFYVYAMASRPVLAAPMVASYCVISVILSRIILKEKLNLSQKACVLAVITGIILLGIADGLAEA